MTTTAISNQALEIISKHGVAEIIHNSITGQKSLHAMVPFKEGDVVSRFSAGQVFTTPNYLTVQRGLSEHFTLVPEFLQYTNHSCNPNVFFEIGRASCRERV